MAARVEALSAELETLGKDYVLVQAFKKAVHYIRHHNWFADVMELDLATVNYPGFIAGFKKNLREAHKWKSRKVRLVPAPKSDDWWVNQFGRWVPRPERSEPQTGKLRPLAHVPLRDQVIATAIMLCLADEVETIQGDPTLDITVKDNRRRVISYGNRLFCDAYNRNGKRSLRHRWGSSKLYRAYFADYQTFVSRPEYVAASLGERSAKKTVIVHSDLSKFYDRVRPKLLHDAIKRHLTIKDGTFFRFATRVLAWEWDDRDVAAAVELSGISEFDSVALPQGLVAAGFFSNIVLLGFDDALRDAFDAEISERIYLRDAARYVDDLRLVVEVPRKMDLVDVESSCHEWIEGLLSQSAPGLTANSDKTRAVAFHDPRRVIIRQSQRMRRIQETVSGGIDANGGTQLLAALEGLFSTQGQFTEPRSNGDRWPLKAIPDVRDETVARFVAGRFRTTYRSLRPLLEDEVIRPANDSSLDDDGGDAGSSGMLTRGELDRQSQAFSLRLIEEWIRNPGNVRLLRVGLDLYPESTVLESVLGLLRPLVTGRLADADVAAGQVAAYCVAEIFRAAATETGLVPDQELLPAEVDLDEYQDTLRAFAHELLEENWNTLPWFCRQQILLFLASVSPVGVDSALAIDDPETAEYAGMIAFLQGQSENNSEKWATYAALARQSYLDLESASRLIVPQMTRVHLGHLAELAPAVTEELLLANKRSLRKTPRVIKDRLSLPSHQTSSPLGGEVTSLVEEARRWDCRIRDELNILRFAVAWIKKRVKSGPLPPSTASVQFASDGSPAFSFRTSLSNLFFDAPSWCRESERWRFELGLLLRFLITGQSDPTCPFRHSSWRESEDCYRPPAWHWEVRRHSLYNGRDRLGPEWIPLSSWMESFLSALLHWPGTLPPSAPFRGLKSISEARQLCRQRIAKLTMERGKATHLLMLPVSPRPAKSTGAKGSRSLKICVAQLAVPEFRSGKPTAAFGSHDPRCDSPLTRRAYSRHLTAVLAGIDQMLRVRHSHHPRAGLDFLIMPELSVHPADVRSRILPFVRKHRCWVFTGLTYHRSHADGPLVNSGLWIVPELNPAGGIHYRFYEQGKQFLAAEEEKEFNGIVSGHRPCQWLLHWNWSQKRADRDLILAGAICYDATDLALAADLKDRSDIFAISALNRDVGTFDRMTEALHYHMFQMVILANHAHFGGSNAYVPFREQYQKQLLHLHGQDQAIIGFLEVADPSELIARGVPKKVPFGNENWKTPPAGWKPK